MAKYSVMRESEAGLSEMRKFNDANKAAKYAQSNVGYGYVMYVRDNTTGKRMTAVCQSCLADFPDSVDLEWYGDQ